MNNDSRLGTSHCPDCGTLGGHPHEVDCDFERCSACGSQRIMCECSDHDPMSSVWTGVETDVEPVGDDLPEMLGTSDEVFAEWEFRDAVDEAVAETFEAIRRHPQDAQFDLLFATGIRNGFNGFQVGRDLKRNPTLWDGFIFGRFEDEPAITLRDIKHGDWNADTLLILAKDHAPEPALLLDFVAPIYDSGELDDLWELAAEWCPAELEWVPAERAALMLGASEKHKLLRVWWD